MAAISQNTHIANGILYVALFLIITYIFDNFGPTNLLVKAVWFFQQFAHREWWTYTIVAIEQIVIIAVTSFITSLILNIASKQNSKESIRIATLLYLLDIFYFNIIKRAGNLTDLSQIITNIEGLVAVFIIPLVAFYLFGRLFNK